MTSTVEFTGVILAAGHGRRMAPLSEKFPKPLLPVCNKPLIQYQIEIMKSLGIGDIVVLLGHKGFEISRVLGDGSALGVSIRYVEQSSMLGIAHAVGQLEAHITNPFLLALGDIFFVPGDLPSMLELFHEQPGGAVLATKIENEPAAIRRNFSVTIDEGGFVRRVVEKPRYTSNRLKGVGLYLFDLTVFDAIRRTPRTAMRDEYEITDAIQIMIDDGHPVRAAESILEDINLTTPVDLLSCNLRLAREAPPEQLRCADARVHPEARLENCVIGAGVKIEEPLRLTNSMVFEGTRIRTREDLDHCVITPEWHIDCRSGMPLAQAKW